MFWVIRTITWCVDYLVLASGLSIVHNICSAHNNEVQKHLVNLTWCVVVGTLKLNVLWYIREEFYLYLLGIHASVYKRVYRLTKRDLYFVVQTSCISAIGITALVWWEFVYILDSEDMMRWPRCPIQGVSEVFGILYLEPSCLSAMMQTLTWFYAILAVKDVCLMNTIHRWMHTSPSLYRWHRTHHEVRHNSRFQLAFHAGGVNLLLEDVGAPFLICGFMWIIGLSGVQFPIYSVHLLALFDGGIHSVNPFTILFWNPVIDSLLNANIVHNLHHAKGNKYLTTVPLYHLRVASRKADEMEYDRVMRTRFFTE